jgi:hypothetical protein
VGTADDLANLKEFVRISNFEIFDISPYFIIIKLNNV